MAKDGFPDSAPDEAETARLVRAALDGPARPLRGSQLEALVQSASVRRSVPGWVLLFLAAGPLAVILLISLVSGGGPPGLHWSRLAELALAIPAVNLALSPFAALLLYIRLVRRPRRADNEKPLSGDRV